MDVFPSQLSSRFNSFVVPICSPLIAALGSPAGNYLFKINNRNTRKMCEICSKLIIRHQNSAIGVVLVSVLLTLNIFHTILYCFYC